MLVTEEGITSTVTEHGVHIRYGAVIDEVQTYNRFERGHAIEHVGETLTSEAFAAKIKEEELTGRRTVFVIGGSLGVHESLIKRANHRICLSKMTFTHQIARFILIEQIYRAYSINNGGRYHR